MRVLQLDSDSIGYELIEPESAVYEKSDGKGFSTKEALVLFTSIEVGDTEALASQAVKEAVEFAGKLKRKTIVIYPFAHLSSDLEEPQRAMNLFNYMVKEAEKSDLKVYHAPFGWNKQLSINVKGHPLAEMSRSYGAKKGAERKKQKKIDLSIVKKSDWAGLPDTDHRTIGERLDLYSFQEVSPGMVYWHPNGHIIYMELLRFIRENQSRYNYQEISAPALANLALWHVSGHIDHYKENMFILESDGGDLGMKPMNCPASILIYKSRKWSYRELPFRTAIMDKLYRNEISGALTGLFRVREMTQDDSHIFLMEEQIEKELANVLKLLNETYSAFGFSYKAKLSTMPDVHMGDEALWEKATSNLKKALEANGIKYEIKEKEGAFYGPKIDVDIKDSQGREWQCATIQVDYQLPLRFKLEYTGQDGAAHTPVIIHRALLGSLERFIGILVEHYQGKFPTWISPVQTIVIPISEQTNGYGIKLLEELKKAGVRAELDESDRTLDYRIKGAQDRKIPYMIIVGKREEDADTVSVRNREGIQQQGLKMQQFLESIKKEILSRSMQLGAISGEKRAPKK